VIDVRVDTTVMTVAGAGSLLAFLPGRGPEHPADLRSTRDGSVVARIVIDTSGRVITGSAMTVAESHRGFGQSVCRFLAHARFR